MSLFEHEHDENCGHDEETHRRMKKRFETFMEDVAEDLFTEKDLANLYMIIRSNLKEAGAGSSLSYLKAFSSGFEFGQYAANNHGPDSIQLIAGMKRIARLKQEDIKNLAEQAMKNNNEEE